MNEQANDDEREAIIGDIRQAIIENTNNDVIRKIRKGKSKVKV